MKIERINITKFGSFQDFNWENSVRDKGNNRIYFKKLNIIYGRNYSGKTTLSRIIRSLEIKQLPEHYHNAQFTVFGDTGEVSENEILNNSYHIRVYNQDFVKDNLSFLIDDKSGIIQTFAIIGDKNNEIEREIQDLKRELGNIEIESSLLFDEQKYHHLYDNSNKRFKEKEKELQKILIDEARKIKEKAFEYNDINYNVTKIKHDIEEIQANNIVDLSFDDIEEKKNFLTQKALPEILPIKNPILEIDIITKQTNEIVNREIKPTKKIDDLIHNSLLQQWVKNGMPLHNNRATCAFCQQTLPSDIWEKLNSHFNDEFNRLELDIKSCLSSIDSELNKTRNLINLSENDFYFDARIYFKENKQKIDEFFKEYNNYLFSLKSILEERLNEPFLNKKLSINNEIQVEALYIYIKELNEIIAKNNSKTKNLDNEKYKIKEELRFYYIKSFILQVGYEHKKKEIEELQEVCKSASEQLENIKKQISEKNQKINSLYNQLQDERKGAECVNTLLNRFFRHEELSLEMINDNISTFRITRNGSAAHNLSEGECSLIAFCYFMAKLKDTNSCDKDLIIYIDDPISSLDNNHIFFVYSLIEQLLAKPKKYAQLFISTHNLDFLKYLKRITIPKEKVKEGRKQKEDCGYFLIQRNNNSKSSLVIMPDYLQRSVTEFNYLFNQVYQCGKQDYTDEKNSELFYSFGNNLRKFLEAYLFFKYPYHANLEEKVRKFLKDDNDAILINRIVNEFSHLEEIFDRSCLPIDIPEMRNIATIILERIKEVDSEQYDSLVKSIGEIV